MEASDVPRRLVHKSHSSGRCFPQGPDVFHEYDKNNSGEKVEISTDIPPDTEKLIVFDEIEADDPNPQGLLEDASKDWGSQLLMALGSVIAAGLAICFLDLKQLIQAINKLHWLPILAAMGCSVASFILGACCLQSLSSQPWSAPLKDRPVLKITVLSQITSNLMSFGGLTGAAMRARLLAGREGHWPQAIVVAALYTLCLNGTSVAVTIVGALVLAIKDWPLASAVAIILPMLLSLLFAYLLLLSGPLLLRLTQGLARAVSERLQLGSSEHELNEVLREALSDKRSIMTATFLLMADWYAVSLVLFFAFVAVGEPMSAVALVACFGMGGLVTLISFVPAGIGVLEASMAGVAANSFGMPSEAAVVAVVLYRVIYYGTPIPLSFVRQR